ncbi:MAG: PDZ domain-containing protein [Planctomycetes bacterium]|nr:PDZ domain-containing protein [Planctomycetota bacterium]
MKLVTVCGACVFALAALQARAQEDKEALKKRILEAVEKKLKAEEERILKEIEKIIDEELAKSNGVKPPKRAPEHERKPEPAKPKGRGYLGIVPSEVTPEEAEELGIEGGVRVEAFPPQEGPAEKAGVEVGDIIVRVDGEKVTEPRKLPGLVQKKGAGAEVTLKIVRDGETRDIKVTLGRHPDDRPEPEKKPEPVPPPGEDDLRQRIKKFLDKQQGKGEERSEPAPGEEEDGLALDEAFVEHMREVLEPLGVNLEMFFEESDDGKWRLRGEYREMFKGLNPGDLFKRMMQGGMEKEPQEEAKPVPKKRGSAWLGVMPEELSDDARAQLDIEDGVGVSVAEARPGSPAEKDLRKGDIILQIDGKPLRGEEGLKKFIASAKPGQEVELTILRKRKQMKVTVTLVERKD